MKINKLNGLDVVFENHADDHVRAVMLYSTNDTGAPSGDAIYMDEACTVKVDADTAMDLFSKGLLTVKHSFVYGDEVYVYYIKPSGLAVYPDYIQLCASHNGSSNGLAYFNVPFVVSE